VVWAGVHEVGSHTRDLDLYQTHPILKLSLMVKEG
jgi:hypothetical protein